MAGSINKVILIGNVNNDPEIINLEDGKEVARFLLITSDSWKDKLSGERIEKTESHKVVVYSEGLINVVKNYVKKGMKLYVEGSAQSKKSIIVNAQGIKIDDYNTEIVVQSFQDSLIMLDRASNEHLNTSSNNVTGSYQNLDNETLDDEIPF